MEFLPVFFYGFGGIFDRSEDQVRHVEVFTQFDELLLPGRECSFGCFDFTGYPDSSPYPGVEWPGFDPANACLLEVFDNNALV